MPRIKLVQKLADNARPLGIFIALLSDPTGQCFYRTPAEQNDVESDINPQQDVE